MSTRMRQCCWCGEELGVFSSAEWDPTDTCGKPECEREVRGMREAEREEAHSELDRERGW